MNENPIKEIEKHLNQYEFLLNRVHTDFLKMLRNQYSIQVIVKLENDKFKVHSNIDHILNRKSD